MAYNFNSYNFLFLPEENSLPLNTPILGRIFNINIAESLYGDDSNPIEYAMLIEEYGRKVLWGYLSGGVKACVIGGVFNSINNYNNVPPQYIINVENGSILDGFFKQYSTQITTNILPSKKYMFPQIPKDFLTYNFDTILNNNQKYIGCLCEFKIKDKIYSGFDFLYMPNKDTPDYITLYANDDVKGYLYTTETLFREFANEKIEFTNETRLPKPLYDWFNNYFEEYVNPNTVISCYQYYSEHNRVDKSLYAIPYTNIEGVFRDDISITNPIFTVELKEFPKFNYVFIDNFNRYYFVDDIICVNKFLYEIHCSIDILMSYKDGIYKLKGFIDRNQFTKNKNLIDKRIVVEQGVNVEVDEITNDVFIPFNEIGNNALVYVMNGYKIDSSDKLAT